MSLHRYRITVTPVEPDGLPCTGRCTIEFEANCPTDWMHALEARQRERGLSGDERTALVVATRLLAGLAEKHRDDPDDRFAALRPALTQLLAPRP